MHRGKGCRDVQEYGASSSSAELEDRALSRLFMFVQCASLCQRRCEAKLSTGVFFTLVLPLLVEKVETCETG